MRGFPGVPRLAALAALLACQHDAPAPAAPPEPTPTPPPPLTEIDLPVLTVASPFRYDAEFRGLVTTLMELGLADLPGVVARVPGDAPPPSLALFHPLPQRRYQATFTTTGGPDAVTVSLTLCPAGKSLGCETHTASGRRDSPHPMVASLLEATAKQLGQTPEDATVAAWSTPGSKDLYAELIAGRSCATYLGLLPAPVDPADKKLNPVIRAMLIDPNEPIARWIDARWQVYSLPGGGSAEDALRRAALGRPGSPLLVADLATTLAASGKLEEAAIVWQGLLDQAPQDPRWLTPYADTLLKLGRPLDARTILDRLPADFQEDPEYARMQVRIAEQIGRIDLDPLLARWQATDPKSPEPVRRRIDQRVADGKYADALALVPALRSRAAGPATDALEVALLTATGQLAAAADHAPEEVADRLRARDARETDPAAEPAHIDDAASALAAADARLWANKAGLSLEAADRAMRLAPDAEAWAARARALEAAGRTSESVQSWQEAWQLDPAMEGGPVQPHRIASTFRLAEAPTPDQKAEAPAGPNMGMEEQ